MRTPAVAAMIRRHPPPRLVHFSLSFPWKRVPFGITLEGKFRTFLYHTRENPRTLSYHSAGGQRTARRINIPCGATGFGGCALFIIIQPNQGIFVITSRGVTNWRGVAERILRARSRERHSRGPCPDLARGRCSWGGRCRFYHDPGLMGVAPRPGVAAAREVPREVGWIAVWMCSMCGSWVPVSNAECPACDGGGRTTSRDDRRSLSIRWRCGCPDGARYGSLRLAAGAVCPVCKVARPSEKGWKLGHEEELTRAARIEHADTTGVPIIPSPYTRICS